MRLTEKSITALKPGDDRRIEWDDRLKGFGVRVAASGAKTYVVKTRVGRLQRMVTLGPVDDTLSVDQARQRAAEAIRQARDGTDPAAAKREARQAMTVAELCEEYMTAARAGSVMTRFKKPKAPATIAIDEGRISRHIVPLIGSLIASKLTTADVQRMADGIVAGKTAGTFKTKARGRAVVTGGAGTATRIVELLGGIWVWARKRGYVAGVSPTGDVDRHRGHAKDRILAAEEMAKLGRVLGDDSPAAAAIRLIALTGWRREEVVGLRWTELDGQTARLIDTKDKSRKVSIRPVGTGAYVVLANVPRTSDEWVFPNRDGSAPADLKASIAKLFAKGGLTTKDEKSQCLRRTFASVAADMGYSDATIAELLGHARRGVTERSYVRRSDPVLIATANAVSVRIKAALDGEMGEVVNLRPTLAKG